MSETPRWCLERPGAVDLHVIVVPRSSRTQIAGVHDDRLKIQLNAPPVEGEANAALVALLSKALEVQKGSIEIVTGDKGRRKTVRIRGVALRQVMALADDG